MQITTVIIDGELRYQCPQCVVTVSRKNNLSRHLFKLHGRHPKPLGRPKKPKSDRRPDDPQGTSLGGSRELQLPVTLLSNEWWTHQPWYKEIRDKRYYWNSDGFLKKLLQLPRLEDEDISGEHAFARIIDARELPKKSDANALKALQDREYAHAIVVYETNFD